MRHFFIYDDKSSVDFDVYIANSTLFDAPKRDVETVIIPGRNGTLSIDNHRFENMRHKYTVYTSGVDAIENVQALRAWLLRETGYKRLEDTLRPDEYYMARYLEETQIDKTDRVGASLTLVFDRKPQRFLKTGDIPLPAITGQKNILNKYRYPALPLIRAYGTGSFTVSGVRVTISTADGYTDIDCDLEEAYKDTLNNSKNSFMVLDNGVFPQLLPGKNEITLTGISKLVITPRWWTI